MVRTVIILAVVIAFSQGFHILNDDPGATLVCNGCQFVVNILETKLKTIETITKTDLTTLVDKACARTPDLEVFKTLCTTVKDDLIDIAIQLIEAVERQVNGNVTCKALRFCF